MREFVMLILSLAVIGSLVGLLSHPSLSPTARAAIAIVTLSAMLSPFLGVLSNLQDSLPQFEPISPPSADGYIEVSESAFCEGITRAIENRFSLDEGEVSVECMDFDFSTMRAGSIHLSLKGSALLSDLRQIAYYVEESFTSGGRCYIDELER